MDIEAQKRLETHPLIDSSDIRLGFIRKVYLILTTQLGLTVLMGALSVSTDFGKFQLENPMLMQFVLVFAIIILIILCCIPSLARQVPTNYILMTLFTISEAYGVSAICYEFYQADSGSLVIWAAVLTLVMTLALTVYAYTTKHDFTMCGGYLLSLLLGLLYVAIMAIVTELEFFDILVTCGSIGTYGIYLVYDTQLIVGGKRFQLSMDDYILAAVYLYLDIIVLFLKILKLLAKSKSRK